MTNKIHKYQLVFLFLLAVINIFFYYFGSHLPDNSFVISSTNSNPNVITFYFYSFISYLSYFVGPWIIAPFFAYSFFYAFVISKRHSDADILVPVVTSIFFYGVFFLAAPQLVGKGLLHLSNEVFGTYTIFFTTLFFGFVVFALTLRGSFFATMKTAQHTMERIGLASWKLIGENSNKVIDKVKNRKKGAVKIALHQKAIAFVKEGTNKVKDKASSIKETKKEQAPETEVITPRVNKEEIEEVEEVKVKENASVEIKETEIPTKVRKAIPANFFKSEELIDCIKTNPNLSNPKSPDNHYFDTIKVAIEQKLHEFKIECAITNVLKGPVVDTFELDLGEGVKLSKVLGLSDDLGLALNGVPIRMVYPMKGKSTIGIEVPRNPREFIFLDEVLRSREFEKTQNRLPVCMGKDAFGDVKVVDLAGMPHMLVAGATGAGKSVFINTMLVSLITKKSPSQLKLILIDPKQLELALYERLPHLMLPVINSPKETAIALLWLVQEMERRYTILKEMGVRNIDGFNNKVKNCDPKMLYKINQYYNDADDQGYELPYLVCVIDEFADLIHSKVGKEIEVNVNRLAAKARAAGIHIVLATQRPSTDVITGVIKANFPTRVAFTVTTGHDSKTILDKYGAEKLLKRGDMLYKHGVDLLRLHSAFIEEEEIEGLIDKLATIDVKYNQGAMDFMENGGDEFEQEPSEAKVTFVSGTTDDPVYNEAIEIVMQKGSASASMLQRALRVGYNRAANIIDEMEKNGIVGPAQGSKPRKVIGRSE